MRLIHAADLHIGQHRYGWTLADQARVLDGLAEAAEEFRPDAVLISGDATDTRRPAPEHILVLVRLIRRIADSGASVVYTSGTHDGPIVIADPGTSQAAWFNAAGMPRVHAFPDYATALVETRGGPLAVVAIPTPHRRRLDAVAEGDAQDRSEAVARAVADYARESADRMRAGFPDAALVAVAHLTVSGSRLSPSRSMAPSWDVTVDSDAFLGYDYAALGHIHYPQQVGLSAWYAGAPEQLDFGDDPIVERGWLLVETRPSGAYVIRIPSRGRKLWTSRVDGPDGLAALLSQPLDPGPAGSAVRFVVSGVDRVTDAERAALARWAEGSGVTWHRVDVERPEREAADRPAIDPGTEAEDALLRYLTARGLPAEPYLARARALLMEGTE